MKRFILPLLALGLMSTSCSSKNVETEQEKEAVAETAVVAKAPVATDGKIIELEDADLLAPGVTVDQLTVVDFNAVWCGPCRRLTPILEEMAKKYAGKVTFISVDVDKVPELAQAYNVSAVPQVVFIRPDGKSETFVGIQDLVPAENFEAVLSRNL